MPLVFQTLKTNIFKNYAANHFLPFHAPTKPGNETWLAYGLNIKTKKPFYENLKHITERATAKKQALILSSFAFYIPTNYNLEKFKKYELDCGKHRNPVELWGSIETVSKRIETHNEVILALKNAFKENPYVFVVDICGNLPKNKSTFDDICHLSTEGSRQFVEILWPAIKSSQSKTKANQ
jgi:hypothetical protein